MHDGVTERQNIVNTKKFEHSVMTFLGSWGMTVVRSTVEKSTSSSWTSTGSECKGEPVNFSGLLSVRLAGPVFFFP